MIEYKNLCQCFQILKLIKLQSRIQILKVFKIFKNKEIVNLSLLLCKGSKKSLLKEHLN